MIRQRNRAIDAEPGRLGFTLIELLVVVVIIAIISGILLPVVIQAADRARRAEAAQSQANEQMLPPAGRATVPAGPLPVIDSLDLVMSLASSYHRIGMDVFTRYRVDCTGTIVFRHSGGTDDGRVALFIPFPENTVEARDVQLSIRPPNDGQSPPAPDIAYSRRGISCTIAMKPEQPLTADVSFTALGREQFDYALPPARQLRSVSITLNLAGVESRIIPDDSLQPTAISPSQIRWEFKNLVSDRRITVQIPGAQSPLARMLLLSRLVALAVLLFGAGFGYLSEQARPGQLRGFRLGHFLLLALTYSLFFVIFAVLEFHGRLGTPLSMAVSALFSLPLLVLHVSRVLSLEFAITRVLPLALFTLGLVIDGVYGGLVRDYVFIGAAILVIAYATVTYPSWAAGRERYRQEREAEGAARRAALIDTITNGIGAQVAELNGADAEAGSYVKSMGSGADAGARARLQSAREHVNDLTKEYEELTKRLSFLPDHVTWDTVDTFDSTERSARRFSDRLTPYLEHLQSELATYRSALEPVAAPVPEPAREGEVHCLACGALVPTAPFCKSCGAPQPAIVVCAECGERITIPVHLLTPDKQSAPLYCPRCGTKNRQ